MAVDTFPTAPWADARQSAKDPSRYLPQNIAHRGYRVLYPENTMLAFREAVAVGAHAIETDLHLSADGVVVLTHDATAKRCFGVDRKVNECTWELLSSLRTLHRPHEPMPRLSELLEWLAQPENHKIWVFFDIKVDDAADRMIPAIAKVLENAPSTPIPWDQRIILGCMNATFVRTCRRLLPSYPIFITTGVPPYAMYFFSFPNVGFNILQLSLVSPLGWLFLHQVRKTQRQLLVWTVNRERWMRWCIRKNIASRVKTGAGRHALTDTHGRGAVKLIDGVITDDPKLYAQVCARWEDEHEATTWRSLVENFTWRIMAPLASPFYFLMLYVQGRVDF